MNEQRVSGFVIEAAGFEAIPAGLDILYNEYVQRRDTHAPGQSPAGSNSHSLTVSEGGNAMSAEKQSTERIPTYCALCVSRCGSIAVVENGRFVALEPDPSHPTGKALCAKGRAAPELVYHSDRLLYPLKRTRPKGDPDPGWQRISWDEALDLTAAKLSQLAEAYGPESVVFTMASPSTSASSDSTIWIERLMRAFGSPNECVSMENFFVLRFLSFLVVRGSWSFDNVLSAAL